MNQKTLHEQLKKIQEKHQNNYGIALRRAYLNAYDDVMKEIAYLDKKDTLKVSELLRKNRYMNLKEQISDVLKALGEEQVVKGIETGLTDGYYGLAYEISKASNKDIIWGLLDNNTVQAAIWHSDMTIDIIKTFNKADWRRRIPKNLKESESFLRQIFDKNNIAQKAAVWDALNQSLIRGDSYQNTARKVRDAFDKGYNQALRVMRTEGHKATMVGELTSAQYASEKGVDLQEFWMATIDLRTRPSHKAMDNKFKNEEGFFVLPNGITTSAPGITGIAEEDIHCRCTMGYVVDGVAPDQRRIGGEVKNVEKDYEKFVYELKTYEKTKKKDEIKASVPDYLNGIHSIKPEDDVIEAWKSFMRGGTLGVTTNDREHLDNLILDLSPDKMNVYLDALWEEFDKEYLKKQDISIRITESTLPKIIQEGRFKTSFEFEGNEDYNATRTEVEKEVFNTPIDLNSKLRPVYGTVGDKPFFNNLAYGNIVVKLKDNVKARTTFTLSDSLDAYMWDTPYTSLLDKKDTHIFLDRKNYWWKNLKESNFNMFSNPKKYVKNNLSELIGAYVEAQVHGGVSLEDIKEIVVPSQELFDKFKGLLKKNNIKLVLNTDLNKDKQEM